MGVEAALLWLLEVVGKKKIGDLLAPRDERALRSTARALEDSQNERDELAGVAQILTAALEQRDALQLEVFALRVENQHLKDELAALRGEA